MGLELADDGYLIIKSFLSHGECEDLIDFFKTQDPVEAEFYHNDGKKTDYGTRKSDIVWIEKGKLNWIHSRISLTTGGRELTDRLQLTRYEMGGHFVWHPDYVKGRNERSLSVSIVLNSAFSGGEFEFKYCDVPELKTGDAIFFDSKKWHRVTPVILGERYSLVGWFK